MSVARPAGASGHRATALAVAVLATAVLAPASARGGSASKPPVPPGLVELESAAEDIVDLALAGNRAAALSKAAELRAAARGPVAARLERAGVPPATVLELRTRAGRVASVARSAAPVTIALAANSVSGLMSRLYAHFASRVPPAILRLDYLDREVQLRALAHQPSRVTASVKALASTWSSVEPKVLAAGGTSQAGSYRAHVARLRRLAQVGGREIDAEATRGLALVDELERVFSG